MPWIDHAKPITKIMLQKMGVEILHFLFFAQPHTHMMLLKTNEMLTWPVVLYSAAQVGQFELGWVGGSGENRLIASWLEIPSQLNHALFHNSD